MILGYMFGRNNKYGNQVFAREKAAELVERFRKENKVTCCRILSAGYEGSAKKAHCAKFVEDSCDILEDLIKVKMVFSTLASKKSATVSRAWYTSSEVRFAIT